MCLRKKRTHLIDVIESSGAHQTGRQEHRCLPKAAQDRELVTEGTRESHTESREDRGENGRERQEIQPAELDCAHHRGHVRDELDVFHRLKPHQHDVDNLLGWWYLGVSD